MFAEVNPAPGTCPGKLQLQGRPEGRHWKEFDFLSPAKRSSNRWDLVPPLCCVSAVLQGGHGVLCRGRVFLGISQSLPRDAQHPCLVPCHAVPCWEVMYLGEEGMGPPFTPRPRGDASMSPTDWREYDGRAPRRRGQAEALDHLLGQVKTVHQHCICHGECMENLARSEEGVQSCGVVQGTEVVPGVCLSHG